MQVFSNSRSLFLEINSWLTQNGKKMIDHNSQHSIDDAIVRYAKSDTLGNNDPWNYRLSVVLSFRLSNIGELIILVFWLECTVCDG